jgi:predicted metal-dependent phosphotriesterase family hydrolase
MTDAQRRIPTGELAGLVRTVLGPVAPESLGVTLPHEHILSTLEVYLEETHSLAVAESTVEELAERLVAELTADAATGGIPCDVLGEIGLSSPMTAADRKVLRAVALAHVDAEIDHAY